MATDGVPFNTANRRKVLKAIGSSGTFAAVGGKAAGDGNVEEADQPRPLTRSERRQAISNALSDERLKSIVETFRKSGWKIKPSDSITLHVPFTGTPEESNVNFTEVDNMQLVVFPLQNSGNADEAAIVWTSERWADDFPSVLAYRAEIESSNSKTVNARSHDVFDANSIITYTIDDGNINSDRNPIETSPKDIPVKTNPIHADSCDCVMTDSTGMDLSCVVTFSIGWAAVFGSCATCGSTWNPISCIGCISSVNAIGGSIPDCAGSLEETCRDFDDMPSRWYAHRCDMCHNLEPGDCEDDFDPCRCP